MEPFTVIIPTLNRCKTLAHTLETCVAQQDENFRILISNNLSTDDTGDIIEEFRRRDARVKIIQPPQRMSMACHYEFALSHVTEGFFMLVGSDDGLLPTAMPRARACLSEHPDTDAMHGGYDAVFNYPELNFPGAGLLALRLPQPAGVWPAREKLEKVALGEEDLIHLPYPYNIAWVRASLLTKLVKSTGRRIHSPVPDTYLSIALASVMDSYVHAGLPFAIFGTSTSSTGASSLPQGDRSVETAFRNESEMPFHPRVGYSRSVDVLVGECLLKAQDAGLLPRDLPLAWDKRVARAYAQFRQQTWNQTETEANMEGLWRLCREFDCSYVMELAREFPEMEDWKKHLPFPLDVVAPWQFVRDTRPLGITGVHQAARMAEDVLMLAAESARLSGSAQSPLWLNQLLHEGRPWEASLAAARAEARHPGKPGAPQTAGRFRWLPKWLRR